MDTIPVKITVIRDEPYYNHDYDSPNHGEIEDDGSFTLTINCGEYCMNYPIKDSDIIQLIKRNSFTIDTVIDINKAKIDMVKDRKTFEVTVDNRDKSINVAEVVAKERLRLIEDGWVPYNPDTHFNGVRTMSFSADGYTTYYLHMERWVCTHLL